MNSVVGSSVPADVVTPCATTHEASLFRLYTLRVAYLIMSAGLGAFIWPNVIRHTNKFAATHGVQVALLAGLGLTAALGLRYPLKMLPILLFELTWKAIYLIAFALPVWSAHQINDATAEASAWRHRLVLQMTGNSDGVPPGPEPRVPRPPIDGLVAS